MCAGGAAAQARASNKSQKNMYEYRLKVRRRKHQQKINRYNLAKLQFDKSVDNINLGLGRSYSRAQTRLNRLRDKTLRSNQSALIKRINKSQYARALAQGKTGRSIKRLNVLEEGALGRYYAQQAKGLTYAKEDFKTGTKRDQMKARTALDNAYSKVVFEPIPDVAPPLPVYQDVGAAKMQDLFTNISTAVSIVGGIASAGQAFELWD